MKIIEEIKGWFSKINPWSCCIYMFYLFYVAKTDCVHMMLICDIIKGNESDVGNTDFELLA